MHIHNHEADPGVFKRIRAISIVNGAIGATELSVGLIANSATLTMAGVHDISDSALYSMKLKAAVEQDVDRKRRLRKFGAGALIGVAVSIGGIEIAHELQDSGHAPNAVAAGVGIIAAAANITAVGIMHRKRHHHDAQDSWKHVVGVDLPGSLITLVVTPLSVIHPEYDIAGAAAHMALATGVGIETLRDINNPK